MINYKMGLKSQFSYFFYSGSAIHKTKKVLCNWLNQNISYKSIRLGLKLSFEAIKTVVEEKKFWSKRATKMFIFWHFEASTMHF